MKSYYQILFVMLFLFVVGCKQENKVFTDVEKETIKKEVNEQFGSLIASINKLDADAWSKFYSNNEFVSAFVSTDYYGKRDAWIQLITKYFNERKSQTLEPIEIRVTPLSPELALMTSEEKTEMIVKEGNKVFSKHVFTMIWKKENDGWKIIHSHESWIDSLQKL